MFWREERSSGLVPTGVRPPVVQEAVEHTRQVPGLWEAVGSGLAVVADCLGPGADVSVTGVSALAGTFSVDLVLGRQQRLVVDSPVAGGIHLFFEAGGVLRGEVSAYLHRLVCTNGLIRRVDGAAWIEAEDLRGWEDQLVRHVPLALSGSTVAFEALGRAYLARFGLLRPVLPVVVDYLGVRDPYRRLVLESFAAEPGDTLAHLVHALARAANAVMLEAGIEPPVALRMRRQLQVGAMAVCERALDGLTSGASLLDTARNLRGLLGEVG